MERCCILYHRLTNENFSTRTRLWINLYLHPGLGGCSRHLLNNWLSSCRLDSSRFHCYCFGDHLTFSLRPCQEQVSNIWLQRLLYTTSTHDSRIHTFYRGGIFKSWISYNFVLWRQRGFLRLCRTVPPSADALVSVSSHDKSVDFLHREVLDQQHASRSQ